MRHHLVHDCRETAVALGGQTHVLDSRRAIPHRPEHLLPRLRELRRSPHDARGHDGEDGIGMGKPPGPKPAADVGRDDAHALGREPKR